MWDIFKTSTEKLAGLHMDLVKKLQDLIKDVQKYVEEQAKAHKKVRRIPSYRGDVNELFFLWP